MFDVFMVQSNNSMSVLVRGIREALFEHKSKLYKQLCRDGHRIRQGDRGFFAVQTAVGSKTLGIVRHLSYLRIARVALRARVLGV